MWKIAQAIVAISVLALSADASAPPEGMVLVPEGPAVLGGVGYAVTPGPAEHRLEGFWIDRFEVTNRDYQRFVAATDSNQPAFSDESDLNQPDQPVTGVTWQDAAAYCAWAGKRLPTETEWEKAARGTDRRTYPWGEEDPVKIALVSGEAPVTVYDYPQDVSPYGVRGMGGNVSEWTADMRVAGEHCETDKFLTPMPETLSFRAFLKGGNWSGLPHMAKSAQRIWDYTDTVADFFGFRCVRPVAAH